MGGGMMGGSQSQSSSGSSQGTSKSQIEIPSVLNWIMDKSAHQLYYNQLANPLTNYTTEHPMETAPADPLQNWVSSNVLKTWETPEQRAQAMDYMGKAVDLSGRTATGEGIESSPAVLKASEAFDRLMQPQIENQMGLSGLGKSSSLGNAMAMGKTTYMLPMIQDELAREQAAITNQANMYAGMVPQLEGMSTADLARQLQTLNAAATQGGTMRGIAQEPLTAAYQDYLRRQALAEQAVYLPFGATATASIGQKSEAQQTSQQNASGKASSGFK